MTLYSRRMQFTSATGMIFNGRVGERATPCGASRSPSDAAVKVVRRSEPRSDAQSGALCHLPGGDGNHGGRRGDTADGDFEGQLTGRDVGNQDVHLQEAADEARRQAGELRS